MRKTFVFIFLSVISLYTAKAQDSIRARGYINELCSARMHGRGYAYMGDSIAADYIRQQFKLLGLTPYNSTNYYDPYTFPVYSMEGTVAMSINGKELKAWDEFSFAPYSHSVNSEFRLLRLDPQTFADEAAFKRFCTRNKCKVERSILYIDLASIEDKEITNKVKKAYNALQRMNSLPFKGLMIGVDEIPVWSFSNAHTQCEHVLCFVKSTLVNRKRDKVKLECTNELRQHNTQNVCAIVEGTGQSDSIVIIGAHYDHLGQMGDKVMFPGCHDNASGTAAMLDMARYFKAHPLPYTTVFVAFSGEEAGLLGSLHFAGDKRNKLDKVKLMLNIDLMCGGDDGFMMVNSQADDTKTFYDLLVDINKEGYMVKEIRSRPNAANSDHYPFTQAGAPAVFIYTLGGRTGGYHSPTDTPENASLSQYNNIVTLLIHGLERFCQQ